MFARGFVIVSIVCLAVGMLAPELSRAQRYRQSSSRTGSRQPQQMTMEERQKQFEERAARQKAEREQWMAERQKEFEQRAKDRANGKDDRRNEAIRQALEMTEVQWKVVEPKINRIYFLQDQSQISIGIGGGAASSYAVGGASSAGDISGVMGMGGHGGGTTSNSSVGGGTVSKGTGTASGYRTRSSSGGSGGGALGGGMGGGMAGGWSGPLWHLADRELTVGEKSCDRLLTLLEDENSKAEQIEQEVAVLSGAREEAAKELANARQELREVLTSRQQARLVLTGLLD